MSPANSAPVSAATALAIASACAIHRLELVLAADDPQFLAMRVIGERFDDVRARVHEIAVDLRHDLGMIEHGFRHERARLHIAATLELEQIALGADDGAVRKPLDETLALPAACRALRAAAALRPALRAHTHGQWLLLAPNVLPLAKRSKANGCNSGTASPLASSFATSLPAPVILKP